jgi:DNA recombination protein RmuC
MDFSLSQKEIARNEAEQLRRISDVRPGAAKLRVVDDE